MSLDLQVHPDPVWADRVAAELAAFLGKARGARVCLATGRTTTPVYARAEIDPVPEVFLLDEFGGLPRDDPARCSSMLRRDLPGIPFDLPDVDATDPQGSAEEYGERIRHGGLDLCVVGLGVNGHVGMNEPGSKIDQRTRVVELADQTAAGALAYGASTRPSWGITVGMAELMEAREVWLVVTGGRKADVLARMLEGDIGDHLPASFLRDHNNASVMADASAARPLNRRR